MQVAEAMQVAAQWLVFFVRTATHALGVDEGSRGCTQGVLSAVAQACTVKSLDIIGRRGVSGRRPSGGETWNRSYSIGEPLRNASLSFSYNWRFKALNYNV